MSVGEKWRALKQRGRPYWNPFWTAIALVILGVGFFILPYQVIPNPISNEFSSFFTLPTQPASVGAEVEVPWIVYPQYTSTQPIELVFTITGGPLQTGQPLDLTVMLDLPASLIGLYGHPIITVGLDNALQYPFTTLSTNFTKLFNCATTDISCFLNSESLSFNRLIFNTSQSSNAARMGPWTESQMIEYTVSGSFGATVKLFPNPFDIARLPVPSTELDFHTQPLYTISSQDTILNQRNAQLSTALTFFILGVAMLEIRIKDEGRENEGETNTHNFKNKGTPAKDEYLSCYQAKPQEQLP